LHFLPGNKANLPELTPAQAKKLQHLTIVSLATKNKCLPYSLLLSELDIRNVRGLEVLAYNLISEFAMRFFIYLHRTLLLKSFMQTSSEGNWISRISSWKLTTPSVVTSDQKQWVIL
jgi:hypothetical protein